MSEDPPRFKSQPCHKRRRFIRALLDLDESSFGRTEWLAIIKRVVELAPKTSLPDDSRADT